ncbi:uncharacterized protein LOC106162413 [Lingula anatina]|uniref:Uncharacterized protein LOC106162413 n=1 Tax=Lingula anatina TaxID=7574 RepID=A0A1S3IA70_LINAN|nr:uncharacterized protein LOC106162413 [Lingula anatina]XP_023933469.1 uncharacterized protein LOC106162413 [Lingula anatina]|eukprot:XP_013395160.1 uncharacterized protein LOC106162413 [Lingula anatina]
MELSHHPPPSSASSGNVDVLISHNQKDKEFADFLADALKKEGIHCELGDPKKADAQRVLDCKVLVQVLSEEAAVDHHLQDEVSLAYISNKAVFPVGLKYYGKIASRLSPGMKLMLAKINWTFFVTKEHEVEHLPGLISGIKFEIDSFKSRQEELARQEGTYRINFSRMTSKTESANSEGDSENIDFWDRHFANQTEVSWNDFRERFVSDYGERLKEQFGDENDDRTKWITHLIYQDIFELRKHIARNVYDRFCGTTDVAYNRRDLFCNRMTEYAVAYLAMKEVFSMDSSVRLTAVRNLDSFHTSGVRHMLLTLIRDQDPNMRAVAALALGRTGTNDFRVIDSLIKALKDEDRLVREATCISLGKLKVMKAIGLLLEVWRNEPIKDVRQAAEKALNLMGGKDAEKAIKVTQVLNSEIQKLKMAKKA